MDYRYALELINADGRILGQVAIEPDWEPALECAAFDAMRRGRLPVRSSSHTGVVEPCWDAQRGRPFVDRFVARVQAADPMELPPSYLLPQARQASLRFVEKGDLQVGEIFRYRVQAFAAPSPEEDESFSFAVEEVTAEIPVGDGDLAALTAFAERAGPEAQAQEFPVFVRRAVLDEAMAAARANPDIEAGGVLVGRLVRDTHLPDLFLEVTAQIPARHTVANSTSLTFTAETWSAVESAITLRASKELRCGWHHSHPNWCRNCPLESQRRCTRSNAFLSPEDVHLHRVVFGHGAHNVALLVADNIHTGMTCSLFGWRRGTVAERGYFIID